VPAYADALALQPALPRAALRGAVLFCGPYDTGAVKLDGAFGPFLRAVLWAYSGTRHFASDPAFAPAAVLHHVTADFPPAFISAGNGDPLLSQSEALAQKLQTLGVPVDTLFFPADTTPRLGHEYQFTLDQPPGPLALARLEAFLQRVTQ
jgi:acetyl esterase/lipase